jgi:tRNA A37 N6-isopentenylltransferase MiaA
MTPDEKPFAEIRREKQKAHLFVGGTWVNFSTEWSGLEDLENIAAAINAEFEKRKNDKAEAKNHR